ncbi:unnamed protein product [Rotaria socialis]|uniref:CCZ1/INTU/HSP4 first Longin domain-containing protein n=1 Tax=Rotaria socialis TaxID=392032 RepID=A0A820XV83_9BILA|nr:unnamed protein product [Rotaria socialis]CAF4533697.1 unnamed protein product [Rotaria socialis]
MQGSKDDNDVLPEAILYFYPRDDQIKKQKLLECGEIVGIVQYFQHDLFQSIAKTFHFQKALVVHEHYGRHSSFLSVSNGSCTKEEAQIHLKHIMDLFNMLYGTWNHIYSIYGKDNKINEFLNQALTPLVNYALNRTPSISHLFSTVQYTQLKTGNQRIMLESKHWLDYLKSKYGLKDGLIGYNNKVLYSTWDADTTFYFQLMFQLRKQLAKNLIHFPWESEFQLKNGVSLFRLYIRRSPDSIPTQNSIDQTVKTTTTTHATSSNSTKPRLVAQPIGILKDFSLPSDDSTPSSLQSRFNSFDFSPSFVHKKRLGMLFSRDQSGSSEETGFETDTMDELSSSSAADTRSVSSESTSENYNQLDAQNLNEDAHDSSSCVSPEKPLTDEDKIRQMRSQSRSRSSTMSNEMEKTIKLDRNNSLTDSFDHIEIVPVDTNENNDNNDDHNGDGGGGGGDDDDDDDDDGPIGNFQLIRHSSFVSSRDRAETVISNPDLHISELLKSDRNEIRVSWKNISDKNTENERDELVLYVQNNSQMVFGCVIEQKLLTDDYLKELWALMLSQMAHIEAEIQATSTPSETIKQTNDTKFDFIENTHLVEYERVSDSTRQYRKIPSEHSAQMALFARTEFKRNPECKVVGLSRGNLLIGVDRCIPNRTTYSCRRFQENF